MSVLKHLSYAYFYTEDHFAQGCEGAEKTEARFKLCQDLWDKIKAETEVIWPFSGVHVLSPTVIFLSKCNKS